MKKIKNTVIFFTLLIVFSFCELKGQLISVKIMPNSTVRIEEESNIGKFTIIYRDDLEQTITLTTTILGNQIKCHNAIMKLDATKFRSRNFFLTRDFRNIIKAEKFPVCFIELENITHSDVLSEKGWCKIAVTIAGVKNTYTIPYERTHEENYIRIKANQPISFEEFNLDTSSLSKIIHISKVCLVFIDLYLQLENNPSS